MITAFGIINLNLYLFMSIMNAKFKRKARNWICLILLQSRLKAASNLPVALLDDFSYQIKFESLNC